SERLCARTTTAAASPCGVTAGVRVCEVEAAASWSPPVHEPPLLLLGTRPLFLLNGRMGDDLLSSRSSFARDTRDGRGRRLSAGGCCAGKSRLLPQPILLC
ncbi:unnamed protein product, partial [Ectocarpus sp. 8 AP-2014]